MIPATKRHRPGIEWVGYQQDGGPSVSVCINAAAAWAALSKQYSSEPQQVAAVLRASVLGWNISDVKVTRKGIASLPYDVALGIFWAIAALLTE